nr:MAG TPA: minor tail protein [Caudoviricetes sp.]
MASIPIFSWKADLGAERSSQPLVTAVSFGDGYELRVAESLNRIRVSYNLNFTRPAKEIMEIESFLVDRGGSELFKWVDPLGQDHTWVCREWSGPTQQAQGLYVLSATFIEVFEAS